MMSANPKSIEAAESTEALRAACARSAELAPEFEKLKQTSASVVDAALNLARSSRRTASGQMRAVAPPNVPPRKGDLTGKFAALK